jgi:hypothetical protein
MLTFHIIQHNWNFIGSVLVNVLVASALDRGFEPRSGQTTIVTTRPFSLPCK